MTTLVVIRLQSTRDVYVHVRENKKRGLSSTESRGTLSRNSRCWAYSKTGPSSAGGPLDGAEPGRSLPPSSRGTGCCVRSLSNTTFSTNLKAVMLKEGICFDSWTSTEAIQMNPRQRTTHVLVLKHSLSLFFVTAFELVSSDGLYLLSFCSVESAPWKLFYLLLKKETVLFI
jgi:hypothetical protein